MAKNESGLNEPHRGSINYFIVSCLEGGKLFSTVTWRSRGRRL